MQIQRGLYRHYKGGLYEVIYTATHTETLEEMVVYKDNKENVWVRPASMWNEIVDTPFGKMKRFVKIDSEDGYPLIEITTGMDMTRKFMSAPNFFDKKCEETDRKENNDGE